MGDAMTGLGRVGETLSSGSTRYLQLFGFKSFAPEGTPAAFIETEAGLACVATGEGAGAPDIGDGDSVQYDATGNYVWCSSDTGIKVVAPDRDVDFVLGTGNWSVTSCEAFVVDAADTFLVAAGDTMRLTAPNVGVLSSSIDLGGFTLTVPVARVGDLTGINAAFAAWTDTMLHPTTGDFARVTADILAMWSAITLLQGAAGAPLLTNPLMTGGANTPPLAPATPNAVIITGSSVTRSR
jgi:hypothetical protein